MANICSAIRGLIFKWNKMLSELNINGSQLIKDLSNNSSNATEEVNVCYEVPSHHILFQIANVIIVLSYSIPNGKYSILFMHSLLTLGTFLLSTWAWNVVCRSTLFSWYLTFMLINLVQTFYLLYTMRQIKFPKELEEIYETLFEPIMISRALFKKLATIGQIMILHAGEAYAMENLTRTDRLGLLISGKSVKPLNYCV